MKLANAPILWITKKLTIYKYSNEGEYRAIIHTTTEILLLHNLLSRLQVQSQGSTILHFDNKVTLHLEASHIFHEITKYIEVYYDFIQEHIQYGALHTT